MTVAWAVTDKPVVGPIVVVTPLPPEVDESWNVVPPLVAITK